MDQELLKLLNRANFKPKESKIYLALLELGKANITQLATRTELKRSIIYVVIDSLMQKGYVSIVPGKSPKTFQATNPIKITQELSILATDFRQMLPLFSAINNRAKDKPKISYFEGEKNVRMIYEEINKSKHAYFISSLSKINSRLNSFADNLIGDLKKRKIKLRAKHILPNDLENKKIGRQISRYRQEVKYLPKGENISMDFCVYDNKVAISSLEDKLFIIVIESKSLNQSMLTIFNLLWKQVRK